MQAKALLGTKNVFLQACPGSGKTTALAGRVAWLRGQGAKVALISFTNVGADEIAKKIQASHGLKLSGDSYIGTIHSFLQKYVLTPFAHKLTGSDSAVRIDPREVERRDPSNCKTEDYTFTNDGKIRPNNPKNTVESNIAEIVLSAKLEAAKFGVVSANDAVYWSARVLREIPGVAQALAERFDEIVVDEAQDTTEMQLDCLDLIMLAGLKSMVLVGDYDQSIYGFNGARRDLCASMASEWDLREETLTENYRSSQEICNASGRLRGETPADTAVGPFKDFGVAPQIFLYSPGKEDMISSIFMEMTELYGIEPKNSTILAPSNHLAAVIRGQRLDILPKDIKILVDAKLSKDGITIDGYKSIERLFSRLAFGRESATQMMDPLEIRNKVVKLLSMLPVPTGDLRLWASDAIHLTDILVSELTQNPSSKLGVEIDASALNLGSAESFGQVGVTRVSTIHGVKGESIDAVALILQPQSERQREFGYHGPAGILANRLAKPSTADLDTDEWRRVTYVAMTRARKLLAIGIPDTDPPSVLYQFRAAGFGYFAPAL